MTMPVRTVVTTLVGSLLLTAGAASAQDKPGQEKPGQEKTIPGDLTLDVPVRLTRLSPSITKVAVDCKVTANGPSRALAARAEAPVTNGQIERSLLVVFPMSQTTTFKPGTVNYECVLTGLSEGASSTSANERGWRAFGPKSGAAWNVSPVPAAIKGDFAW
jgi:hypothetical protein